ncbi:MAG: aminotransferase class I/II-fold pyridoxal phosphate-dependent enzyme [Firmicutes bacterium]|nr:aminotransferase class I/II-fold pyridoxal phosphate-dependent enzyme [Bacillota bacterium]
MTSARAWDPGALVSPVVRNLPPSGIRRFFELVSQTKGIVSLGIGEPDFATPWHAREASVYYLEKGHTSYTSNWGMPLLREEIARYLARQYNLIYNPEKQVLVTVGVSEAVDLALRVVMNPGDEVLIPEPAFVSYSPITIVAGGRPVPVATRMEDEFRVTPEALEAAINERTKALILSYPNNPTGAIMPRENLEGIAEVARRHNLLVISDEIYSELTYEDRHTSIASLPDMYDRVLLLNGFSKAYAMTGWRIGYAAGHEEIIAAMCKLHQYTIMCAPTQAQYAAIEALKNGDDEKERMIRSYDQRRRLFLKGIQELGLECFEPKGAFYAFPSIKKTGMDSEQFAQRLLLEEKVAVVPGNAFGESGEGHIRCCYAVATRDIETALERIGRMLSRIGA